MKENEILCNFANSLEQIMKAEEIKNDNDKFFISLNKELADKVIKAIRSLK